MVRYIRCKFVQYEIGRRDLGELKVKAFTSGSTKNLLFQHMIKS